MQHNVVATGAPINGEPSVVIKKSLAGSPFYFITVAAVLGGSILDLFCSINELVSVW